MLLTLLISNHIFSRSYLIILDLWSLKSDRISARENDTVITTNTAAMCALPQWLWLSLQGYLAHKKTHPPRTLQ